MFKTLLVANRGEIAVRVIRTCRRLGVRAVAVYSDADAGAMHVRQADSAEHIGPSPAAESYLDIDAIIEAAQRSGAEAIHPGYGFLSENADFAAACGGANLVFIGPSPEAIAAMGDKVRARQIMAKAGVPVVPGYDGTDGRADSLADAARDVGFPLLVKAAAGGGGRGMRVVREAAGLDAAIEAATREATAAFGDGRLFLERLIEGGRHIEAQVFGSRSGEVIFLGERDCSVQRRHQKVIEETPSPAVGDELRARLGDAAVKAAQAVKYTNAGTVEFLLAPGGEFYFLEMNTRLQVEHPVTEEVLGVDLVEMQLLEAAGDGIPVPGQPAGHAIEFRLYAEDAADNFAPRSGALKEIQGPDETRLDSGYESGDEVPSYYDSLLAKLIVKGATREQALARGREALGDLFVRGVTTNLPLLRAIAGSDDFNRGETDVTWLERMVEAGTLEISTPRPVIMAALLADLDRAAANPWLSGAWRAAGTVGLARYLVDGRHFEVSHRRLAEGSWLVAEGDRDEVALQLIESQGAEKTFTVDGMRRQAEVFAGADHIDVTYAGNTYALERPAAIRRAGRGAAGGDRAIKATLPGVIVRLLVAPDEVVEAQQAIAVLEAMKMEHVLRAPRAGRVVSVEVAEGQKVEEGEVIAVLDDEANEAGQS